MSKKFKSKSVREFVNKNDEFGDLESYSVAVRCWDGKHICVDLKVQDFDGNATISFNKKRKKKLLKLIKALTDYSKKL